MEIITRQLKGIPDWVLKEYLESLAQIMGLMQLKADIDSYRNVFVISAIIMVCAAIVAALTLKVNEVKGIAQVMVD
jgi:hypothetical protein